MKGPGPAGPNPHSQGTARRCEDRQGDFPKMSVTKMKHFAEEQP